VIGVQSKARDAIVIARFSLWRVLFFALFFLAGFLIYNAFGGQRAYQTYLTAAVYSHSAFRIFLELFCLLASCIFFAMVVRIWIFGNIAFYIQGNNLHWTTLFGDKSVSLREIDSAYTFFIPGMIIIELKGGEKKNIPVGLTASRPSDVIYKILAKSKTA